MQRDFDRMVADLTAGQRRAATDLALGSAPRWLRPQLLGLELDQEAPRERGALIGGLEALCRQREVGSLCSL
jgi:hypothetical protein